MGDLAASHIVAPALAIAAGGGGGTVVTNLLPNPSFEATSGVNYTADWQISMTQTTTDGVVAGTRSLVPTVSAGGARSVFAAVSTQAAAVVVGTTYTASFHVKAPAGKSITPKIRWFTSGYAFVSQTSGSATTTSGGQDRFSVTGAAPATAAFGTPDILYTETAGESWYFDAFMLAESATLYSYFDGDTPAGGGFTYAWTGTAHASTSTRTG